MKEGFFSTKGDRILFRVYASPGASKTEAKGLREGALRVRLAAAPEKGKANRELEEFIAGSIGCSRSEVEIVSGDASRAKTLSLPLSRERGIREFLAKCAKEGG
jgi:uncharacterized protein (TIGR00251 family)